MSGSRIGGIKAAKTNKRKHGRNFYKEIGAKGGKASTTGGFFADRELASRAGTIGGRRSKRGPAKHEEVKKSPFGKFDWIFKK